jgi:hypothetical protein
VRALILELVEEPTLAERLGGGAMPVREALSVPRQIAEALDAAHEKGIVQCAGRHSDLFISILAPCPSSSPHPLGNT